MYRKKLPVRCRYAKMLVLKLLVVIIIVAVTSTSKIGRPDDLPTEVDWRKRGLVTPSIYQGECGDGWAFAAADAVYGQLVKKEGKHTIPSVQNLVDCSRPQGNYGCEGGYSVNAFKYIIENGGMNIQKEYPYAAHNQQCRYNQSATNIKIKTYLALPSGSELDLQRAVANVGPVAVDIQADLPSFRTYNKGVYDDSNCTGSQLDHGVLVVGYGVYNGTDVWIVKNSYGVIWGMNGYILIARNKNNLCGIASRASFPILH
ncbi:hypothetical protein LOTGIDRAFT_161642 [Lottia gigantea]|uniref:Peptidase C1A papain C-terminal domain-containing protein n=1 Tax=Lottia gigantea TaxID=225164 RepID=V4BWX2_LOTGI|nr:hypothetical protein LOTGIDRAFT_161642 [Lottia gigantea]ESO93539.1 hypothetical protein LOTGIDRAFT_161642 [Lottia gigantea]